MSNSVRSTQRAPRTCIQCSKRKVKCSKTIPCRECSIRGSSLECRRELVRVRGQVRTADSNGSIDAYQELLQQNARLRALVVTRNGESQSSRYALNEAIEDETEQYEQALFKLLSQSAQPISSRIEDILMPSKHCSYAIVEHSVRWTHWIHFALFTPQFNAEHDQFWAKFDGVNFLDAAEPLWLAVYFSNLACSLVFMGDSDIENSQAPGVEYTLLLRNWYAAALLFLEKGQYMQTSHVQTVQAIAILGVVCTVLGDSHRQKILWGVAIRVAQELSLGQDSAHPDESLVAQQTRRRLWWTLVLCEWLPVPYRAPFINDIDFDCKLPEDIDDEELASPTSGVSRLSRLKPRPVQYHITMIKIATIYYQLRYKLRLKCWTAAEFTEFVFLADDQLANLVGELSPYLASDEPVTADTRNRDALYPWIPWQRRGIAHVLLYYRISINRLLQKRWLESSDNHLRTRAICLSSAQAIVYSTMNETVELSKLRTWDVVLKVFSASITLALELRAARTVDEGYSSAISQGVKFLRSIRPQIMIVEKSIELIESLLNSTQS